MKTIELESEIKMEISEGEELFDFAKKILDNELFVKGFSLRTTLIELIDFFEGNQPDIDINQEKYRNYILNKTKNSFICLLKSEEKYIGMCAFFEFHACSIQTFIKNDFRGNGIAFEVIKKVINIVTEQGLKDKISFHHGEAQSLILFYKLWKSNLINISNILEKNDKDKLRYIKNKIKGIHTRCFLSADESEVINCYIKKMRCYNL